MVGDLKAKSSERAVPAVMGIVALALVLAIAFFRFREDRPIAPKTGIQVVSGSVASTTGPERMRTPFAAAPDVASSGVQAETDADVDVMDRLMADQSEDARSSTDERELQAAFLAGQRGLQASEVRCTATTCEISGSSERDVDATREIIRARPLLEAFLRRGYSPGPGVVAAHAQGSRFRLFLNREN